ncbi:MAG: primosomal protein N' [Gammaproteobacteria bacterium]|nr:primosomal protein N' [Gammaproteobacteria bacterium]
MSYPHVDESSQLIAEVLLPVPLSKTFDYLVTKVDNDNVGVGKRVVVEFGNGKMQVGIILSLRQANESDLDNSKLKSINEVLDDFAVVDHHWQLLIRFASRYYAEPLGKAYKNAFPKRLRIADSLSLPRIQSYTLSVHGQSVLTQQLLQKKAKKQHRLLALLAEQADKGFPHVATPTLREHGFTTADCHKALHANLIHMSESSPFADDSPILPPRYSLNNEQQQVVDTVIPLLNAYHTHLLYGVTGSGKTEVYINLIETVLAQDKQVLLLVPEIALTPQMLSRFTQRFGRRVAAYHSGMSDKARQDIFVAAKSGELPVLIGTRSAIFIPHKQLGLILVDEEHDVSYKQHEGFLYHARDLAIYRAKQLHINVVLGSATPSLESVDNVLQGKFTLHHLTKRATQSALPEITMIDRRGHGKESVLADSVIKKMRHILQQGKQVLIFLNRRGFAPVMKCNECDWSSDCPSCSVFQTAHTTTRQLCCHHCGHVEALPVQCPNCQCPDVYFAGAGTQKLESQIHQQFPQHRLLRLDRDKQTTSAKLDEALESIHQGDVDIIIGTQLVVKGHHFPNVELVCVADADSALFSSDFRAEEHLYQQLIQVAGRAGRESNAGKVLIQSTVPDHDVFHALIRHDYWAYAEKIIAERKEYELPPSTAMVLVRASALDRDMLLNYLRAVKDSLCEHTSAIRVLGPVPLAVERVKNRYQAQLWLSAENKSTIQKNIPLLEKIIRHYDKSHRFKTIIDVDSV